MDVGQKQPIEPVCKFGPGGDFVSVWPRDTKGAGPADARSSLGSQGSVGLSGQTLLFTDVRVSGSRAGHKPKHHIQAYRRTATKKPAEGSPPQGTLFETNSRSARTA